MPVLVEGIFSIVKFNRVLLSDLVVGYKSLWPGGEVTKFIRDSLY